MFQVEVFRCTKCEQLLGGKTLGPDGELERLACPFCALVSRLENTDVASVLSELKEQAHRTYCLRNGIEHVTDLLLTTDIVSMTPDERAELILTVCESLRLLLVEDSKAAKEGSR